MRLSLKEWQFADGSKAVANYTPAAVIHANQTALGSQPSISPYTGRKLRIHAIEGRNLAPMDRTGKSDPYLKLFYGKVRVFILFKRPCLPFHRTYMFLFLYFCSSHSELQMECSMCKF